MPRDDLIYDIAYSDVVQQFDLPQLSTEQTGQFERAIERLLADPTTGNPEVSALPNPSGRELWQFILVTGEITITYHFLTEVLIEITLVTGLPVNPAD